MNYYKKIDLLTLIGFGLVGYSINLVFNFINTIILLSGLILIYLTLKTFIVEKISDEILDCHSDSDEYLLELFKESKLIKKIKIKDENKNGVIIEAI